MSTWNSLMSQRPIFVMMRKKYFQHFRKTWPVRNIDRNGEVPASILLLEKKGFRNHLKLPIMIWSQIPIIFFQFIGNKKKNQQVYYEKIYLSLVNITNQNQGLPRKDAIHEKKTIISLTIKSSECDTYRKMNITDYDGKRKYKYFNWLPQRSREDWRMLNLESRVQRRIGRSQHQEREYLRGESLLSHSHTI